MNMINTQKKLTFTKKENKAAFEVFDFIYKATSKDTIKPVFMGFYVDKENCRLVSTDGRRMHIVEIKELTFLENFEDKAVYKITKKGNAYIIGDTLDVSYVDYKRVIPKKENQNNQFGIDFLFYDDYTKSMLISKVIYKLNTCVNIDYIKEIFSTIKNKSEYWNIWANTENQNTPVYLRADHTNHLIAKKIAIIMPIKCKR